MFVGPKKEIVKEKVEVRLFWRGAAFAAIVVVIDQFTKWWIFNMLVEIGRKTQDGYPFIKITDFFNIVYVLNSGVSFGLLRDIEYGHIILSVISLALIIFLLGWLWKNDKLFTMLALSLIIGGAIGNLIDRVRTGAVRDFLDFHLGMYHWPAFNVADTVVCIGVFLLIAEGLFFKKRSISALPTEKS